MEQVASLLELDDPDRSPVRSFGFRLWHVEHAWNRRLEAALAPFDLTHMQYVLLRAADHLAKLGERPAQSRLAECLVTDKMMVSKVLRLLECKGLIVRAVHPEDARANHVVLTEAGRRTLAQAIDVALAAQEAFFGRLGESRKRALGAMLDDLLEMEGNPVFRQPTVTLTTMGEGAR
jgi:DNA-binding MarR family transcriptional regulator